VDEDSVVVIEEAFEEAIGVSVEGLAGSGGMRVSVAGAVAMAAEVVVQVVVGFFLEKGEKEHDLILFHYQVQALLQKVFEILGERRKGRLLVFLCKSCVFH
jgi:hypothetical protein